MLFLVLFFSWETKAQRERVNLHCQLEWISNPLGGTPSERITWGSKTHPECGFVDWSPRLNSTWESQLREPLLYFPAPPSASLSCHDVNRKPSSLEMVFAHYHLKCSSELPSASPYPCLCVVLRDWGSGQIESVQAFMRTTWNISC